MRNTGTIIKHLRTQRGMTIDAMTEDMNAKYPQINLNKSMLSRWENNINEPSLDNARYLSMYFKVSLDYIAGLKDHE